MKEHASQLESFCSCMSPRCDEHETFGWGTAQGCALKISSLLTVQKSMFAGQQHATTSGAATAFPAGSACDEDPRDKKDCDAILRSIANIMQRYNGRVKGIEEQLTVLNSGMEVYNTSLAQSFGCTKAPPEFQEELLEMMHHFKENKDKERDAMATAIKKLNSACIELGSIKVSCMRAAGQVVVYE